ncbi:S9 family peptidase [Psychrobium sp. 1_MG-2023]|uniref:alpha/beta hydrolase family protein n=1 Tax=Psychrobium sp. 1_MG-2023 TaxID=3062624 RepID=UPI000C33948A|nr:S9 family peptidase [Psychrobium sp. 1_MG-2023]MDP2562212.1 S9 family peptidase [Psychrobium sp. 1_MG-2023]PKF58086.1 S9 family peptidase [Alteromonadales bacterium alter-6D02]
MKYFLLFWLVITSAYSVQAYTSPKQPSQPPQATLPYSVYAKLPAKSLLTISPSGNRMAYRHKEGDDDYLVVMDLNSGEVVGGTGLTSVNPDTAYFIDENRIVLVASVNSRIFGFRGRHDISAAFSYNIKEKTISQLLIAGKGIYRGQSNLGNVVGLSEDRKHAYMPAWHTKHAYSLLKVNLDKTRKPRVHKKGTSDTIDFFIDGSGLVLARERFYNRRNVHILESWQQGEWKVIYREETDIRSVGFVGVTPDGKSLVMQRHNSTLGRWAYHTISLEDGRVSDAIFSKKNHDVEVVLTDINRVVYGVRYSGFKPSYEFFETKLNARLKGVAKVLPELAITITDYTPDWSTIIFHIEGDSSAGDYIRYKDGSLDLLTHGRPDVKAQHINPIEVYSFKARDGLTIPTLLTLPKHLEPKNLPAIMLPHGGPESYDKIRFDWLTQYFASQGYLVIQPQFRGSKGFGAEHLSQGHGEWGLKMQDDLTDAVGALIKEGKIDANRVCIVGASYGGYAALAGAVFTPNLYQCAVSINGVSDVKQMLRTEKHQHGSDHWVVSYWQKLLLNGSVESDHLETISPINFVKDIKAPVLLIHGEHDLVVPMSQSKDMHEEMEDTDKEVSFITLEKGNHYLSNSKNREKALKAIDLFIKQHLP